jgi:putative ABC transport system substrate-binding protein
VVNESSPRLARVIVIGTSTTPGNAQALREIGVAARAFAIELQYGDVLGGKDIEPAFRAAGKGIRDAVLVLASPLLLSNRGEVASLAAKMKVPTMYYTAEFVEDGGLISYGVNSQDLFRRAAGYVDKILKGTKPADLPVEQPIKLDLVINLKAAKALGLPIPPGLLLRADRVIE